MKKFLSIALAATCLIHTAQAQQAAPRAARSTGAVTSEKAAFKQKTAAMKAALNTGDYTKVNSMWLDVHHMMARRGDEIRKAGADIPGAERRYALAGKLKDMSQNWAGNKAELLRLLDQMDATF